MRQTITQKIRQTENFSRPSSNKYSDRKTNRQEKERNSAIWQQKYSLMYKDDIKGKPPVVKDV